MSTQSDRAKPIPGYQNPECYARALGGCCRQVDGEHYVSKAILERIPDRTVKKNKAVLVQNLSFQKQTDAFQAMGVGSLTANVLCKVHNNGLSDYDAAGLAMYEAMDAIDDETRTPVAASAARIVDGDALERWMLKTVIGGYVSGNFRLPAGESMKGVEPPLEMLEILYRGRTFPAGQGMFWMPSDGPVTTDDMVFRVGPVPSTDNKTIGAFRVWFFGFEFNLLMAGLAPGVPTVYDEAAYRPAGLRVEGLKTRIRFDWKSGPGSDEIVFGRLP
jgi:hypothetical protein